MSILQSHPCTRNLCKKMGFKFFDKQTCPNNVGSRCYAQVPTKESIMAVDPSVVERRIAECRASGMNENNIIDKLYKEFKVRRRDIWACVYASNVREGWKKRSSSMFREQRRASDD